jgi:hypothetical protein
MPDIRIVPGNAVMSFTSSLNYIEKITQEASGSLNLYGSGSTGRTELLSIDGNNGRLFTVSDDLSDSLFSVNTIAGLPVIEAFANNTVVLGQYGQNVLVVTGSRVGIKTNAPEEALHIDKGSLLFTSQSANSINVRLSPGGGTSNIDNYLDLFAGGSRIVRMGSSGFDINGTGLFVSGRIGLTAEALGTAATQILVVSADPASTQRLIQTRTPAQLRSDIGAGVGSVTSIATNNGVTGGTITSTGTIGLATAYGDTINPYASKTANTFLAAPNGSNGVPSFRAIAAADIPTLNQNTTGTATNATNINITTQDTTPVTYNVTFTGGTSGMSTLNVDTTALRYTPSTSTFETPIVNSTTAVRGGNGSAGAPAFSFSGDTDNGMYYVGTNSIGLSTGGTARMVIDSSGRVGVSTTSMVRDFQVGAFSGSPEICIGSSTTGTGAISFGDGASGNDPWRGYIQYNHSSDYMFFGTTNSNRLQITSAGAMGLGIAPTNTSGRFEASNDIVAFSTSDKRWKNNIVKIDSPLEKISQISGVEFDWIEDEPLHGNKGHDVGVIAQEIELIIPEAVQTRESGMKAVQYDKIIPLLIECIKDQQKQIEELKQSVNAFTK